MPVVSRMRGVGIVSGHRAVLLVPKVRFGRVFTSVLWPAKPERSIRPEVELAALRVPWHLSRLRGASNRSASGLARRASQTPPRAGVEPADEGAVRRSCGAG